ncbi:hypothetical protein DEO72_LG1g2419 [Vigna unguiculata]|uniref:Uncharacterized protein n=1 Tax=Vigna unguiculata TaxID=3917 RepID=A0A4D6KQI6_VIGUN|nr:hypothetical protein DEO72_LG1g2419 [Vigna unguiculata]
MGSNLGHESDSPKRDIVVCRILELWLGIGVKHVAFYRLWPGMTSLDLWLGIPDEHEELLSCGSGW